MLWDLATKHILTSPYLFHRSFLQGAASGVAFGLITIVSFSSIALFFEIFALIFGGDNDTMWQIIGVIFSLPWPGLFASPHHALPWVLSGIVINLLLFGLACGIYKFVSARRNT